MMSYVLVVLRAFMNLPSNAIGELFITTTTKALKVKKKKSKKQQDFMNTL